LGLFFCSDVLLEEIRFRAIPFEDPEFVYFVTKIIFENSKKVHEILKEGGKILSIFLQFLHYKSALEEVAIERIFYFILSGTSRGLTVNFLSLFLCDNI
jgi:hypothetical protein